MTIAMTPERLRGIYGDVSPRAAAKELTSFDAHCRQFIEHATFMILASSDGTQLDVSPKGDPAGFVTVENDNTLLIPDRPGNNRIDGLLNILAHPNIALLFMIPSVNETLRVNGHAEILDDPAICERFQMNGRAPKTVLRVSAQQIFLHCGKAPMRAKLWVPDSWPTSRPIPSLYEIIRDHAQMEMAETTQAYVEKTYRDTLY